MVYSFLETYRYASVVQHIIGLLRYYIGINFGYVSLFHHSGRRPSNGFHGYLGIQK